jgi:hypothetical protein
MILLSAGLVPMMLLGCVEREWTLRTEPAGAIVWVSGVEKGRTPVTIDFTWYGEYEVIFRKEGYETLKTTVKLDPPPYEYLGADFFSEIAPWTYHDRRETLHTLSPRKDPPTDELIRRAEQLRGETLMGQP